MKFSKIRTTRQAEILHLAIQVFVGGVIWMASSLNVAHADVPTLPPTDVTAPAPGCPPGQVNYGSSNGQCGPMPGGTQPGQGPSGSGGPGGYGGGSNDNPAPPKTVAEVPSDKTCDTLEELRLADANSKAGPFAKGAKRGDFFKVDLADGNTDTWEYICGGKFCAGTVLNVSPVSSSCN